jgi:(2Fe-2S) ferredoxin
MKRFADDGPEMMVCVNKRFSDVASCAGRGSEMLAKRLEEIFRERGITCRVRGTVCQNACERGPNMRLFPHRALFFGVTESDLPSIADRVAELLGTSIDDMVPPI